MQENAFLRAQIEEKDALIKEQTKLLDQQQQLNLITGKRLNELETKEQTETEEQHSNETVTKHTVSEGKKGFLVEYLEIKNSTDAFDTQKCYNT